MKKNILYSYFALILCINFLTVTNFSATAQGTVGVGRLPRTTSEVKRTLKTILIVKLVKADANTMVAKDEITGEELTYKISKNSKITAEKGFFGRKKELAIENITAGQRLEASYRENIPTQLTSIKILKPKS